MQRSSSSGFGSNSGAAGGSRSSSKVVAHDNKLNGSSSDSGRAGSGIRSTWALTGVGGGVDCCLRSCNVVYEVSEREKRGKTIDWFLIFFNLSYFFNMLFPFFPCFFSPLFY